MKIEINESDEKLAAMVAEEIGQELDETGRLLAERVSAAAQPLLEKAMLAAVQHVAVSLVYGVLMGKPHPACESDDAKWRAAEALVGPPPPLCRHGNPSYCGLCLAETGEGRVPAPAPAAVVYCESCCSYGTPAPGAEPLCGNCGSRAVRKYWTVPAPAAAQEGAQAVAPAPAEEAAVAALTEERDALAEALKLALRCAMWTGEDKFDGDWAADMERAEAALARAGRTT